MSGTELQSASEAVQSAVQSRTPPEPALISSARVSAGAGELYSLGERLFRSGSTKPYQRKSLDPLYRRLSIFALDPGVSKLGGAVASIKLQYEPLPTGLRGDILEVDSVDANGTEHPRAYLDDRDVLLNNGYRPSVSDPRFHQQMVYSVAMLTYANFRLALGRNIAWAFSNIEGNRNRLKLRPFGAAEKNAWYDRSRGEIVFGYFIAERSTPVAQEGVGRIYTSLSHDVIVHEMSHALLDGLRAHFFEPSHPDVLAFHEAFADLIAFFQHFAYEDVVRSALSATQGRLTEAEGLVSLAQEFGRGMDTGGQALRTLADLGVGGERVVHRPDEFEPHERGKVLSHAVFDAFETLFRRRTRKLVKLATGGSGVLPPGDLPRPLEDLLVKEAHKLASQFLTICIRAIDYCPPTDLRFGDYLRALITADSDLVPDDDLAYREAIIRAFGERRIFADDVTSITEDALVWRGPRCPIPSDPELKLASLRLTDDLSEPADGDEINRLAGALGKLASDPAFAHEFGLLSPSLPDFDPSTTSLPTIESVRIARRIGPNKQLTFDLVAEITQRTIVRRNGSEFPFFGGATIILDAAGEIRFVISKRLDNTDRQQSQWNYMHTAAGSAFWRQDGQLYIAEFDQIQRRLCMTWRAAHQGQRDQHDAT